ELLERAPEERTTAKELHADRRRGACGDVRDFVNAQLVEIAKHDHDAVKLWKQTDRGADPRAIFTRDGFRVGGTRRVGDRARMLYLDSATQLAPALSYVGHGLVRRDPDEPMPNREGLVAAWE